MVVETRPTWCTHVFETLDDCLQFIQQQHRQRHTRGTAVDVKTDKPFEHEMPSWLYRGEVGWFDECLSRWDRVRCGKHPGVCWKELERIGRDLNQSLQSVLAFGGPDLRPELARGFADGLMQHYGWPTEFMDATAELSTAARFACSGAQGSSNGTIAVFDTATLTKSAAVFDLSQHPAAKRAVLQEAYGIRPSRHCDLKQQESLADLGITWYAFRAAPEQDERVESAQELLSVLDDATAGVLRLWVDGAIEEHGKVSHPVAEYLADRIAHCPVVGKVTKWRGPTRQPEQMVPVPAHSVGISVDEQKERDESIKLWSREHPEIVARSEVSYSGMRLP